MRTTRTAPGCRRGLTVAGLGTVVLLGTLIAQSAQAQQQRVPGGTRDCQTVRVCNFARNAAVRGCLSSYTCRRCRLVPARCKDSPGKVCQEMVCTWGG